MNKWDQRFLELAQHIATWSKDPSTKVGCIIVGPDREIRSEGYNGFPRGVLDSEFRLENRELKYQLVVHAEMNALLHAARVGTTLRECTAYVSWPSCVRCATCLIQAGIVRVVWPQVEIPQRWQDDFRLAREIFREAGIQVPLPLE